MPSSKITLAVLLLPFTLAIAGPHNHESFHKHEKEPYQSGSVSNAPFASGTGGPFVLNNATASAAGSGTGVVVSSKSVVYTTIRSTIYQTVPASNVASGVAAPSDAGSPISQAGSVLAGSGAGNCPAPVTVTEKPTVTVTVTNNDGSPAGSGVEPAAVASSSPATIASASAAPDSSEPDAPVQSPAAPVASSPAAGPASSQAPQSSEAASVAPVASSAAPAQASSKVAPVAPIASGAPVQSDLGSPAGLSPKPIESSPAVAASSAAAAPSGNTVAPATSGPTGSKRGLAFVAGNYEADQLTKYANAYAGKIAWVNNFFCGAPTQLDSKVEFIPQMYGLDSVNDWNNFGKKEWAKGAKHMFSFGEAHTDNDRLHQEPAQAAKNWKEWMAPMAANVSVGAPSVLQGDLDTKWLREFLAACTGCNIGFIAHHWVYKADLSNIEGFKNATQQAIDIGKAHDPVLPVWVDNFQGGGTSAEQIAFLDAIVPWLENNPDVHRYGYLPPALDNKDGYATFLNPDGSPSDLAKHYATMP